MYSLRTIIVLLIILIGIVFLALYVLLREDYIPREATPVSDTPLMVAPTYTEVAAEEQTPTTRDGTPPPPTAMGPGVLGSDLNMEFPTLDDE